MENCCVVEDLAQKMHAHYDGMGGSERVMGIGYGGSLMFEHRLKAVLKEVEEADSIHSACSWCW